MTSPVKPVRPRRAQVWIAYLLLAIATLVPSVCVLWLVRKTVENEKLVVEQVLREATALRLETAERTLFEELSERLDEAARLTTDGGRPDVVKWVDLDLADASILWDESLESLRGVLDSEAARERLGEAREAFSGLEGAPLQAKAAELLSQEEVTSLRFEDGRSVAGMIAMMAIERLRPEEPLSPDLSGRIEALAADAGGERLLERQRSHLLKRLEGRALGARLDSLRSRQAVADQWLREAGLNLFSLPQEPIIATENCVGLVDLERSFALVFRKDRFAERWLKEQSDSVLLARKFVVGTGNPATAQAEMARAVSDPFGWLELKPLAGAPSGGGAAQRRTLAYVWIGGIVLALSVVSGGAIVLFIRSQMSAAQLKNDLVATVSHELKTPIASIRLLVDTMRDESRRAHVDRDEYLALIDRENRRLGHLIDNFLTFSRLERNKKNFVMRPVDPAAIAREAETAFRERFKDRAFELSVELETDVPEIQGDREALWTALGNLLENALKYGGSSKRIGLRLCRGRDGAAFEVEDQGLGIARKDRKRIFKRFYQAYRDHGEHTGSVGLGLSIVEFIVSSHGGTVEVESELGKGSLFRIIVPYA